MRYNGFKQILDANLEAQLREMAEYQWTPPAIRALREYLGMYQEEFGKLLVLQRITISEWECGGWKPDRGNRIAMSGLAKKYGFTPDMARRATERAKNYPTTNRRGIGKAKDSSAPAAD